MKDLLVVMKFTMKDMIKRKSFIISTIIFLIMIVVGFNIPNILKSINGEDTSDKLVIVDEENIFEGSLESLKNVDTGYEIEISNSKYEEIKEKINNDEIESAIIVEKTNNNVKIRYIVKNTTMMANVPDDIISMMNSLYSNLQISKFRILHNFFICLFIIITKKR